MKTKNVLRNYFTPVILLICCCMPAFAQRQDILLNDGWNFRFSHQVQKNTEVRVDLPHTWNAQDDYEIGRASCRERV